MEEREDGAALHPCERRPPGPVNRRLALGQIWGPPTSTTKKENALRHLGTVAAPLGKGEVHSSILCGSTIDLRPINSAFNHKIRDLVRVAAIDFVLAANPVSTRTKREAACQLT